MSMIETDGPYGGYTCSSNSHKHHVSWSDSVFQQNRLQSQFYKVLRNRGIYINQPDTYFLQVQKINGFVTKRLTLIKSVILLLSALED